MGIIALTEWGCGWWSVAVGTDMPWPSLGLKVQACVDRFLPRKVAAEAVVSSPASFMYIV